MPFLVLALLAWGAPASAVQLRVVELTGDLRLGSRTLKQGEVVAADSLVTLAAGGRAVLGLDQGVLLLKGPASFVPEKDGLSLKAGGILSVLKTLKKAWRMRTAAAVASVRGTEFYMEARADSTYLCLCRGALDVAPPRGKIKPFPLRTAKHAAYVFRMKGGTWSRAAAGLENHTDEELASLRGLLAGGKK